MRPWKIVYVSAGPKKLTEFRNAKNCLKFFEVEIIYSRFWDPEKYSMS